MRLVTSALNTCVTVPLETPDVVRAVIGEEIVPVDFGDRASIDDSAGHASAAETKARMVVLPHRVGERGGPARRLARIRVVAASAFLDVPAVVQKARVRTGLDVNLFVGILPDIADVEVSVQAVEAESEGVPQSVRVGLKAAGGALC